MAKEKEKTNVMRLLDAQGIDYTAYSYPHKAQQAVDGVTVAQLLGWPVEAVFKTLVTRANSGGYYVFVIPVAAQLDLKAAARAVGEKAVEMIAVSDLYKVTGYIRGGCSPIGMKKPYPVRVDASCLACERMLFSAGKIGYQVALAPADLLAVTGGQTAALTV